MRFVFIFIIRLYKKFISPFLPPSCIYTPSCSSYAEEALNKHGTAKGLILSVKRVFRCHPWHKGGYDPVPEVKDNE